MRMGSVGEQIPWQFLIWLCGEVIALQEAGSNLSRDFRAPSPSKLPEIGQPIVDALMSYRATHGRFPTSLAPIKLSIVDTFYGPWEYHATDDGSSCQLSVGDYGKDLFTVSWSDKYGWNVDT